MLSALRINYYDHQSSAKSLTYCKSVGSRLPLRPSQPRSLRSFLVSTLRGAKCCSSSSDKALDPSKLMDMTKVHEPRPKTSRGRPNRTMSSGNDRPCPPTETAADSASSFESSSSNDKGKGQRHSPFRRLIKLVSPIKGLPGLLSHRKVSKKESRVDKPVPTKVDRMVRDDDDFEDDISVLELPIEESYNKEPSSPAAGIGNTANSESESKSSHVSDAVEAGVSSIKSIEYKMEPDLPGMVSTTTAGVSACKSKVHHAPKVLAPVLGPLPSVSSEADAKPSSTQPTKRRTPLYRMKMLLDLKKVTESSEEADMPHIPTLKEWLKQEKRKERAEKKKAKKAIKREKQLKRELEQKEQKMAGAKTKEKRPAWCEANEVPQLHSGSQSKKEKGALKDKVERELKERDQKIGGEKTKEKRVAWGEVNQKEKVPQQSGSKGKGATKVQLKREPEQKEPKIAGIKTEPKMAWCEVNKIEESPQQSGIQSNGIAKVQPNKELELVVVGVKMEPKQPAMNEKEISPLQRPLGAHHNRRRSTLVNVQEKSPKDYYSRGAHPDSDSDMNSDEDEQRVERPRVRRPLAAHYKRRRSAIMENVQQKSPEHYCVKGGLPKDMNSDIGDEQRMRQDSRAMHHKHSSNQLKAQGKVTETDKSQEDHECPSVEPLKQRKLAWMH